MGFARSDSLNLTPGPDRYRGLTIVLLTVPF